MTGNIHPAFVEAEAAYRRERISSQFRRTRRPFHLRWPTRAGTLRLPGSRTPRPVLGAPHHATSH
jgi:hypothetical protein